MLQYHTNAGECRKPALGLYGELKVDGSPNDISACCDISATAEMICSSEIFLIISLCVLFSGCDEN